MPHKFVTKHPCGRYTERISHRPKRYNYAVWLRNAAGNWRIVSFAYSEYQLRGKVTDPEAYVSAIYYVEDDPNYPPPPARIRRTKVVFLFEIETDQSDGIVSEDILAEWENLRFFQRPAALHKLKLITDAMLKFHGQQDDQEITSHIEAWKADPSVLQLGVALEVFVGRYTIRLGGYSWPLR